MTATRILFTGYAPAHVACFGPIYERLAAMPSVDVFVSGGLRRPTEQGMEYDTYALFDACGVPREHVLTVPEMREQDFDALFASNTKMIAPRSAGTTIQIFHGISFRNRAVRAENVHADHYFVIGPYMHRRFAEAGLVGMADPRFVKVGFPKTDRLRDDAFDSAAVLSAEGLAGDRPVILYAPTGQKNNSLETMGEEVIRRLSETGRYDVLIKPHDHPKNPIDWRERLAPLENEHTRVARDHDVVRLLCAADLLITDASSVSSEYALRDRPMVFLDVPKLIAKAAKRDGSMLDLDTWGRRAGTIVEKPKTVVDAVEQGLAEPMTHSDLRRAMADDLFYNPGRATDVALEWIESNVIGSRVTHAAG